MNRIQTPVQRIVLGIAGVATPEKLLALAQCFVDAGTEVQVVIADTVRGNYEVSAFETLTGLPVRGPLFDPRHEAAMGHIELARWPDAIVIAPAPPRLLAALARGMADDLLTTLCLATDKPVFVAAEFDEQAAEHAAASAHSALLAARGLHFIRAANRASAMAEIAEIQQALSRSLTPRPRALLGLRAVVTAGPTQEPVDSHSFISNRSSGKQGFALAEALRQAGASVTLIAGPSLLSTHPAVRRVDVQSAQDMLATSLEAAADAQVFIAAAAVADYRVATVGSPSADSDSEGGVLLDLVKNPDILATLRAKHPKLFLVGFAAETEQLAAHAQGKLARKGLNMIAANWVGQGRAFDTEDNALTVFWPGGQAEIATAAKSEVAHRLVQLIAEQYAKAA